MKHLFLSIVFAVTFSSFAARSPEALLSAVPEPCTDQAYLLFNETGNRTEWGRPYVQRTEVIEELIAHEAREGKGRFLPKLTEFLEAILAMRTWTINAHDGALKSFNNEQPIVELGSARLGLSVARTLALFGDRLSPELAQRARAELERRIFAPYLLTAAEAKADPKRTGFSIKEHWWFRTRNNWNAVCHSLVVRAALVYYPENAPERATIVSSAVDAAPYFLSGFTEDGYCSEGAGYWNYGYGHFLELGLALRAAPEKIDLFANPKTRTIAEYGFKYKMTPTVSPQFADGGGSPDEKFLRMIRSIWPDLDTGRLDARSVFPEAQVFIARGIAGGLSLGFKGGHNDEFHNHNDLGSYNIAIGDTLVTGDVGGEVYTKRTFSKDRYVSKVLNSYGHPVPRVNGTLQGTGGKYRAKVLATESTDDAEKAVLDLTGAYDCPELKSLVRTFAVDRRAGTVTVSDEVSFTRPSAFVDPLLTVGAFDAVSAERNGFKGTVSARHETLAFTVASSVPGKYATEEIENPGKLPARVCSMVLDGVTQASVTCTFSKPR